MIFTSFFIFERLREKFNIKVMRRWQRVFEVEVEIVNEKNYEQAKNLN